MTISAVSIPKRCISLTYKLNSDATEPIEKRLEAMVNNADVVLFMKGMVL